MWFTDVDKSVGTCSTGYVYISKTQHVIERSLHDLQVCRSISDHNWAVFGAGSRTACFNYALFLFITPRSASAEGRVWQCVQ